MGEVCRGSSPGKHVIVPGVMSRPAGLPESALTHDAEDGTGTPMLMARSGHTSVRSLAKYARVSAEALARHQAGRDPARRR